MKTIILTDTSLWGGLETHAAALADVLAANNHHVTILCLDQRAQDLFRRAVSKDVVVASVIPPTNRGSLRGWLRSLEGLHADSVLLEKGTLHTGSFALDCALRLKFGRYAVYQQLEPPKLPPRTSRRYFGVRVPVVGLWWYRWRWSGYLRSLVPRMTICVSDSTRDALALDYDFPRKKLVTIRHGVDQERFRPDRDARATARAAWNVPPTAIVFGSVRRFVYEKGLDVLVKAFAQVKASTALDVRLVLIGEGPEQPALEALASTLGVSQFVVFPGFTQTPWLAYPALDVFVIPSRIEALGVVVVEAMASECYVIASRVGGIPEMVSDTSLGTLVPPGDSAALADAMAHILTMDRTDLQQHLNRARKHVGSEFNLHTQSMRIAEVLNAVESGPTPHKQ